MAVIDELDNLDHQRASIEERKDAVKEKDMLRAQSMLSMSVSVTNIMPNFEDQDKISGYIVDKNMKKLDKFQFEKTTSPVEICDMLWKMIWGQLPADCSHCTAAAIAFLLCRARACSELLLLLTPQTPQIILTRTDGLQEANFSEASRSAVQK